MPIHVIWGDNLGAIDRSIEKLIEELVDPNWITINLSRLDGQSNVQAIQSLEEVRTPPFGQGHRVIILNRSPFFNGCSKELSDHFESIVNFIPKQTHLILINQMKPDGRLKTTKLIKELITQKIAIEKSYLLPAIWDGAGQKKLVEQTANDLNITLSETATYALIDALGNDSQRIYVELRKLMLLEEAKAKGSDLKKIVITEKTVTELIQGISTNCLQICNFIITKDFAQTIFRIDCLLDTGEPPLRIIAALISQIRGWLWVSLLEEKGEQEVSYIAKAAGIANPKRIYVIRKQIKGKPTVFFIDLLSRMLEIESLLKKGTAPKNAFRDGLLTKI